MTKSDLIENLVNKNPSLQISSVEECVKHILEKIISNLEHGNRIEIRGFGSFSLHFRQSRTGRNPKTGQSLELNSKYVPHFKAGKQLKERVDHQ